MTSGQAQEIIHWFNEEAFGVSRSSLLDNFSAQFYSEEGLPLPDRIDQCIILINNNLLAYKGIAKINQHLPFHFNLILSPEQH